MTDICENCKAILHGTSCGDFCSDDCVIEFKNEKITELTNANKVLIELNEQSAKVMDELTKERDQILDTAIKYEMDNARITKERDEVREKILNEFQLNYDFFRFNGKGDGSQPLIELKYAKDIINSHLKAQEESK